MFYGCSNLTSIDISKFNTENVNYMDYMFADCSNLISIDISKFNIEILLQWILCLMVVLN